MHKGWMGPFERSGRGLCSARSRTGACDEVLWAQRNSWASGINGQAGTGLRLGTVKGEGLLGPEIALHCRQR